MYSFVDNKQVVFTHFYACNLFCNIPFVQWGDHLAVTFICTFIPINDKYQQQFSTCVFLNKLQKEGRKRKMLSVVLHYFQDAKYSKPTVASRKTCQDFRLPHTSWFINLKCPKLDFVSEPKSYPKSWPTACQSQNKPCFTNCVDCCQQIIGLL